MSDWNSCQKSLNIQMERSGAVENRGWTKIGGGDKGVSEGKAYNDLLVVPDVLPYVIKNLWKITARKGHGGERNTFEFIPY
jgi:hypothetical protein